MGRPEAPDGAVFRELPLDAVRPNRLQPRRQFDQDGLGLLAESVRQFGVLQPVLVRRAGAGYELVAGERRWRAARLAGMETIPAIVRDATDLTSLEQALVENIHRTDLNPLEEAAAYQQLLDDFAFTHQQVAERVGRSRATVTNAMRLLQLTPSVQRLVVDGRLSAGHARALLGTDDRKFQEALAERAAGEQWSVRAVEEAVRARVDVGPDASTSSRPAAPRARAVLELEEVLSERLSTRVTVTMGARRGRVVIEFAGTEDLDRIYQLLAPAGEGGG